jgi:predicted AAA+ superfamily ATPase
MPHRYVSRDIEKILMSSVKMFPSVIITGPRQSGKTTLLKHLFSKTHSYVSMDNPDLRLMAINEAELFFKNYKPPIIIDEVQYAPQIFSYIKMLIDKERHKFGQFILTGSQLFPLMANVGESLAGRIGVFTLLPFSIEEQINKNKPFNNDMLKRFALRGGFPEITLNKAMNPELWFAGYLQTYLERDVRQLRQIGSLVDFQRFLQLIAAFNGQAVNLSSLSRDLGVAINTIKAWLSILEASSQIILIKPFYLNKGKRIIKSPKIYFLDTGLLCYLSGISSINQIFKGPLSDQLFETVVIGEIVKRFYNNGKIPKIYWWRTSYGEEVDFVIEDKGKIIPIEVKLSAKINMEMAKGLINFYNLFSDKIERGFLINLSQDKIKFNDKIESISFIDFAKLC